MAKLGSMALVSLACSAVIVLCAKDTAGAGGLDGVLQAVQPSTIKMLAAMTVKTKPRFTVRS